MVGSLQKIRGFVCTFWTILGKTRIVFDVEKTNHRRGNTDGNCFVQVHPRE